MKTSTKNNIKGKLDATKGKVKEVTGKIVGNPQLECDGRVEKVGGKVQQQIAKAQKALGN